jgi:hypothetical protein
MSRITMIVTIGASQARLQEPQDLRDKLRNRHRQLRLVIPALSRLPAAVVGSAIVVVGPIRTQASIMSIGATRELAHSGRL